MNLKQYQQRFPALKFEQPGKGILEIIFDTESPMNTMNAAMHKDVAYV